ncbi:hypothetical protein SAMN06295905_3479 [Devosia lucknowensis]|uniref:Nutrient deprivation-induced protein n=2 Tax=Devosia lucknowensis TaxID=1096929 RepID=A0A1Y6GCG3_9HYPH|nr:hypothetical protein SAMN06295905_3479 [Devosia lucknowensis]
MSIEDPNQSQGQDSPDSQLKEQVGHDIGIVTDQARHDLDAIAGQAKADARKLGHEASEKISEVKDKAKGFAGDQKDLAANQINGVAAAINKVADELGSEQQTVARYARDLASGLSSMGKTIKERDVDDLMGLAQDFGRKQPVAFLGAAALAGFVASRFALASNHRRDSKIRPQVSGEGGGSDQRQGTSSYEQGVAAGQRAGGKS